MIIGLQSAKMDVGPHCFLNYSPKFINLDPSTPKPQNIDIGLSFDSNGTIESLKKGPARAILLWSNFSKFYKSNIARAGPFLDFCWIHCYQMTVLCLYFVVWAWTDQGF